MSHLRLAAVAAAALILPLSAHAQAPAEAPAAPAAEAPAATAPVPGPGAAGFSPLPTTGAANIVDTLKASGQFTTLLKAADQVNLTGLLSTRNPLTLIAPTDAAFAQLPPGQLDELLKPENAQKLQGLIVYHLVALKVTKDQIAGHKGPIPSAAQKPIEADGSFDTLKMNDAVVLQAEVPASNGAIYVVDKVLTPPA
jgi:uncharacterized surface protein with fasciclin (FAS1) repeats